MEIFVLSASAVRIYNSYAQLCRQVSSNYEIYSSQAEHATDINLEEIARDILKKVPYRPSPYCLFDHHGQLQTAAQYFLRNLSRVVLIFFPNSYLHVHFTRELIELPDGGVVAVDWASLRGFKESEIIEDDETKPIILLHHGLVGDSQSEYIYHLSRKLLNNGYRVGVMIARGCGNLPLKTIYTFAGRKSCDIRSVIQRVRSRYPIASKLFWMGFSLGAAATLHYLEDFHDSTSTLLDAVMCVSPPWSLRMKSRDIWTKLMALPLKLYMLQHAHLFDIMPKKLPEPTADELITAATPPPKQHVTLWQFLQLMDIWDVNEACYRGFGGLTKEGDSYLVDRVRSNSTDVAKCGLIRRNAISLEDLKQALDSNHQQQQHGQLGQLGAGSKQSRRKQYLAEKVKQFNAHYNNNRGVADVDGLTEAEDAASVASSTLQQQQQLEQQLSRSRLPSTGSMIRTEVIAIAEDIPSLAAVSSCSDEDGQEAAVAVADSSISKKKLSKSTTKQQQQQQSAASNGRFNHDLHDTILEHSTTLQYQSVEEYYDHCSPNNGAHLITTPCLTISAKDDPICSHAFCPREASQIGPGLVIVKTELGGHLAFPEEILPLTHAWTDRVAVEWFNRFL